jgi:hypothetical protein
MRRGKTFENLAVQIEQEREQIKPSKLSIQIEVIGCQILCFFFFYQIKYFIIILDQVFFILNEKKKRNGPLDLNLVIIKT